MTTANTTTQAKRPTRLIALAAIACALVFSTALLAGCACSSNQGSSSSSSSSATSSHSSSSTSSATSSKPKPAAPASSSSAKPKKLQVPDLANLDQQDAIKLLKQLGFKVWEVDKDHSDTIAKDHVISQSPQAREMVEPTTKIVMVVSDGKKAPAQVAVPNIVGMSQGQAEQALADAKLVPVISSPEVSSAVDPGKVCKQSIPAGTSVMEGTAVAFATALAEDTVAVPDVKDAPYSDAKAALEGAGLGADPSSAYSDSIAKDNVISQSIPAGTKVVKGTVVKLQVSMGPKPVDKVKVPYILTASLDEAIQALESAGLEYRYSGDVDGTVVYVSPEQGTEVEVGSAVTFTLEHVATLVEVPDVKGKTGTEADKIFKKAGLKLDYDTHDPDRVLKDTDPTAGTLIDIDEIAEAVYDEAAS